eukprot:gnl/TRDRNA2_/TRDRNA2_147722_c0_seq1.p1 gnl/TRDRNA2_/TRDRNA2_147722_c0~~gnl/TRDRNA2_/TRDRNA2_147722_c0_seq1.p1  ORF type:complete len:478 (-),score=69.13 gnl/TRDRNA2_/TRDRNA2_147722_c0_seq1:359-1762(-)
MSEVPLDVAQRFVRLVKGDWCDLLGNSISVIDNLTGSSRLSAVLRRSSGKHGRRGAPRSLEIQQMSARHWRCGCADLAWADEEEQRIDWATDTGIRIVWSRDRASGGSSGHAPFPWLASESWPEAGHPLDVPSDVLLDGARVAAILDVRQIIGADNHAQEVLTQVLMDHDLADKHGDYLVPSADSTVWRQLPISEALHGCVVDRIRRLPREAQSTCISWSGDHHVLVGHHRIHVRARDIQKLESRWMLPSNDASKLLQMARLLALYSVFDNPLSDRRSGFHLGLPVAIRKQCDYELFASPLNAVVSNTFFASKWPHVEWRFGSMGAYPHVLAKIPKDAVVCANPPFTDKYLADVMARIPEMKQRFRLRLAIPVLEAPWRKSLRELFPGAELLCTYYDASAGLPMLASLRHRRDSFVLARPPASRGFAQSPFDLSGIANETVAECGAIVAPECKDEDAVDDTAKAQTG